MGSQSGLAKILGPLASGLIAAVLVILTVLVAVLLGSGEQTLLAGVSPTATETVAAPTPTPPSPSATSEPTRTETLTPTPSLTPSSTPTPRPSAQAGCIPPAGWVTYTVRQGDTLTLLAWRFWTTEYSLMQANCLTSRVLRPGQIIHAPNVSPRPPCGRPSGWVAYTVRPGDTLFSIAVRFNTTVTALKRANCLTSDRIVVGATLWVPYRAPTATPWPTRTPTAWPTVTPSPSLTATSVVTGSVTPETPTPVTPTSETPTSETPTPETPTPETPTPETPTPETPTPETSTPEPTDTSPPPTATEAPSDTPAPPTATPVPPTPTNTPIPPTATDST